MTYSCQIKCGKIALPKTESHRFNQAMKGNYNNDNASKHEDLPKLRDAPE